jgi:hypothetical protein
MWRALSLGVRNVLFTIVVPGLGGVWVPWWLVTRDGHSATVAAWAAVPLIAAGAALYAWCVWNFAAVGDGTPGLWDAPARVVATGPYRWVRNPIYLAALLVVLGEAWLFMSLGGAGLRRCHGDLLSPVRHRLRGTQAGPPLRRCLPGVPAQGPTLDPPPARPPGWPAGPGQALAASGLD